MLFLKHMKEDSFVSENTYFVKKGTKLEYTEEEKSALAVFILVIVFSNIEILAAAIAKSSHQGYRGSPAQRHPMYYMYYQVSRPYQEQASAARCYTVVVIFQINLSCFINPIRSCGGGGHNVSALAANDFFLNTKANVKEHCDFSKHFFGNNWI